MPDVVTVDQIRELIKSENIRPSDLFPMEKLVADPAVKGFAEDRVRERIGSEYQRRKEAEEKLERIEKEHGPKEIALQEEIKGLKKEAAKAKIPNLFTKIKGERKLDEKQEKFLLKKLDKFEPKDADKVETEVNTFVDDGIAEYNALATDVFGIKQPEPEKGKGGAEPGDGKTSPENPFIPTY